MQIHELNTHLIYLAQTSVIMVAILVMMVLTVRIQRTVQVTSVSVGHIYQETTLAGRVIKVKYSVCLYTRNDQ